MLQKIAKKMFLTLLFYPILIPSEVFGKNSSDQWILEVSPFRGIWGQASLRFEGNYDESWNLAVSFDSARIVGERKGFLDQRKRVSGELIWYVVGKNVYSLFTSLGLGLHDIEHGREQELSSKSRQSSGHQEKYLQWSEKAYILKAQQSLGIRLFSRSIWTSSLRFVAEETLYEYQKESQENRELNGIVFQRKPQPNVRLAVMFFAGLSIP